MRELRRAPNNRDYVGSKITQRFWISPNNTSTVRCYVRTDALEKAFLGATESAWMIEADLARSYHTFHALLSIF